MFTIGLSKHCCKNPKNLFCFVCGLYIMSHHKRSIMTRPLMEAYEAHFKVRTTKENYLQGPPSVCNVCNNALLRWKNGMCPKPELPFAIPMLWSAPTDHETDCYFCLTRTATANDMKYAKLTQSVAPVEYPILRSAVRPKLFATQPAAVSQVRISTPLAVVKTEKEDSSANLVRTYPGQIKLKESATVMKVERQSLPAPNIVSSVQTNPSVVSTSTLKRKVEPSLCVTYGVTKVRLRNSEPTIVLDRCKKLLPSNPSAIINRPVTPSNQDAPRILNVFSLNKDAANCETVSIPPAQEPDQPAIKIEVVDDEEEVVPNKLIKLQPINGTVMKAETMQQAKEETLTQPKAPKQIAGYRVVKIEPSHVVPYKTEHKIIPIRPVRSYNAKDLSATNNGERTIKIIPPVNIKQSADVTTSSKAATFVTVQTNKVSPEQQQKTPLASPAKHCFINMKDLPSSSASNNDRTIKIISPAISQQLIDTEQQSLNTTPVSIQRLLNTTPVTVSPGSKATPAVESPGTQVMAEQDDIPHRITQSELILLLRELELPKEKSAILIDRLKRWNLLAIEMVGTNRVRSFEPTITTTTTTQLIPVTQASPPTSSPPTSSPPPPPPASQAQGIQPQLESTVATVINMKDIQIRNTRAANRQSAPPIIISNATTNRTKVSTVSKQDNEVKPNSSLMVLVKGEQSVQQQRRQTTVSATEKETVTLPPRGTITTRSAASALVKQNATTPKVK